MKSEDDSELGHNKVSPTPCGRLLPTARFMREHPPIQGFQKMDRTSSCRRSSTTKKYKAACDQCHSSKVKCSGGDPPCKRCADARLHCHYSLAARIGKPPGSKNRKTLEKLNNATKEHSKNDAAATISEITTNIFRRRTRDEPNKEWETESRQRNDHQPQSLFLLLGMPGSPSLSPPNHCFDFLDSLNSSDSLVQEFQERDSTIQVENDGEHAIHSTTLSISGVGSPGEAGSQMSWTDMVDNYPRVCINIGCVVAMLK